MSKTSGETSRSNAEGDSALRRTAAKKGTKILKCARHSSVSSLPLPLHPKQEKCAQHQQQISKQTSHLSAGNGLSGKKWLLASIIGHLSHAHPHIPRSLVHYSRTFHTVAVGGVNIAQHVLLPVSIALDVYEIGSALAVDLRKPATKPSGSSRISIPRKTTKAIAGVAGGWVGGGAGAFGGMQAGAAIGSGIGALFGGGVGAVPGAAVGGLIGSIAGSIGGGMTGAKLSETLAAAIVKEVQDDDDGSADSSDDESNHKAWVMAEDCAECDLVVEITAEGGEEDLAEKNGA